MNAIEFFDTNILIYAHDTLAPADKRERAQTVLDTAWDQGTGHLSTQVLQELYVVLGRKTSKTIAQETVMVYLHWPMEVITPFALLAAMNLSQRHQLAFWDALIVTAAQKARASILWTEDLQAGQRFGDVVVRNPFLE